MTWFVLIAAALVVVALLWLMPVLLRRRGPDQNVVPAASNLAILKDQLAELERDLASGVLLPQQYQLAREDLERRALEEARDAAQPGSTRVAAARRTALALAIGLPVCAALLYWQLGSPDALLWRAAGGDEHKVTPQEVEAMVARLAARLEKTPDDANGWALLGRSYGVMQRYQDSASAYARAAALIKDDADLLADYADALAMSQGRRIDGKALQLVELALEIDPLQWKALAMAGTVAFDRKEYKKAIGYWERLLQRAEPDSELARSVASNIEEARQLGRIKAETKAKKPVPVAAASVHGTVSLSGQLAGKFAPTDTVFIFARAAQGPRMPLAILRRQVKDLPAAFTLDDSQAMSPEAKLSRFSEIVVGARISRSGSATPQSGDWQGTSQTVKVGAKKVAIVIDSAVP
jgi:cytochrome c-type biogenesis protein CcmH